MIERRSLPWFGLSVVLLVGAGLVASVTGAQAYLPRLLALAGLAGLLWSALRSWRQAFRFLRRMRSVAEPGPFLTLALAGAVLIIVAAGMARHGVRYDLTRRGLNSLSEASREALALPGPEVEMVAVYRESAPAAAQAASILRIYRSEGRGIRTRRLDPERDPQTARALGIEFANGVLVHADSAREVVDELSEEALTSAILRVRDPRRPLVGLLEGHGESGGGRAGLAELRRSLERSGFSARRLVLADLDAVPAGMRVLLVTGPATPLFPGEIARIGDFLDRGGRLGVFLDPETPTGLEQLMASRGIVVDGRRIRDDGPLTRSVGLGPETIAVQSLGQHAISHGLTAAIVLRGATRVGLQAAPIVGTSGGDLLKSAPSARRVAAAGDEGTATDPALSGVQPLGSALEWPVPSDSLPAAGWIEERRAARLLVVGDSDLLRDDGIGLFGNRQFVTRSVAWLAELEYPLAFPPIDPAGTPLRVGLNGFRLIFLVVQILLPGGLFLLGLLVWLRRR